MTIGLRLIQSVPMNAAPPLNRDRLSLLTGGAALGLVLSRVVQLPTQQFGFQVFGSPLGVRLSSSSLMTLFVVGLVITGVQSLLEGHPLATGRTRTAIHWILPALTALMAGVLLAGIEPLVTWMAATLAAVVVLGLVAVNEYRSLDQAVAGRVGSQVLVAAIAYCLALGFLSVVYGARLRTLVAGPAVLLTCGLLAVRLLWSPGRQPARILLYAAVIGLIMAQCAWVLGYWSIAPLSGGTILLLVFYALTGVAQGSWKEHPGRRALLEYGLTALIAVVVALVLRPG